MLALRIFMNVSVVILCFALVCNSLQGEQKQKYFLSISYKGILCCILVSNNF